MKAFIKVKSGDSVTLSCGNIGVVTKAEHACKILIYGEIHTGTYIVISYKLGEYVKSVQYYSAIDVAGNRYPNSIKIIGIK